MQTSIVLKNLPKIISLEDEDGEFFGHIAELTSESCGADRANIARISLFGPDFLHHHKIGQETYFCESGRGLLFLGDQIIDFTRGTRVIINPGTIHAAKPKENEIELIFLCVSSPPYNPQDEYRDPRGRNW